MIFLIGLIILTNAWTFSNTYMHIEKVEYRWLYSIYSTIVIIIWILLELIFFL